jgi:hypothetical protein
LKNASYTVNFYSDSLIQKIGNDIFGIFCLVWNKMYKKSAIASLRFDPQIFGIEDAYFSMCVARFIKKHVMIDAKLYGYRQYANSSTKLKSVQQVRKRIAGNCRWIENVYSSFYDSIPLAFEQKRIICCGIAIYTVVNVILNHFEYENIIYASEQIYNLYSKGFIDISCFEGFYRKIFLVPFIVIGKVRSWFKVS